ncbi:antitoxin MazE-like protein [Vibrio parahaemolyticus]|uniref:antitoxin MazE-like protein n=1 Tax=Vibrio parahaemolyticus TaxID=670 RepID=UPI00235F75DB|nr:antitoxin MazE-like protein [Vibrio parahaemolyticus]
MSRNTRYEQRMKERGLKKVTLWVPSDRESDIKQAASVMCDCENLTVGVLKDVNTGRMVSMH